MTLSNRPLLPAGEREDECGPKLIRPWLSKPSWDPETETTASCRDFWKNWLSTRPSSGGGKDALTLSWSSSLSLGHPSRGLLLLRLPPVDGDQDGRGGLPSPSSTAPLLEAAADAVRERGWMPLSATSRLGAATGGRVEAAAARRGRKC